MAETPGRYGLEVENKSLPPSTEACTAQLSEPRPASEKSHQLQQARVLAFNASVLSDAGKYAEGLESAQKALELRERELGPEDASVAFPLYLLGNIYLATAELPKAEAVYQRALKIQEKTTGPASDSIFKTLNNLGVLYAQTEEFDKAELSLQRALDVGEKMFGVEAPALANSLVNLADVYDMKADYSKAIIYYERARAIAEKTFGPDYPGLATIVANLAGVYSEKGDYLKAESLGQRAVSILERTSGPEDRRLGVPLENLADAYRLEGAIDKAEPLYKRALKIFEKTQGPEHPLVADTLTNLADIDHDRRDFATAEALYQRALAIREKKLGADHPDVALSFEHLGTLFRDRGDYGRAEDFYRRALAIREKALGPEHPDVVNTLTNLSTLQMAMGNFGEAEGSLSQAIAISEHNADLNLLAGSERQKLAYLKLLSPQLNQAITLNASLAPEQAAARDLAATTVLQRKGRVQDLLSDNLQVLRQHLNNEDAKLLDAVDDVTSRLARLVLGGPANTTSEEHQKRVNALKEEREHLEAEISKRSAEFLAVSQPVTLEAVRSALPGNTALLEFMAYRRYLPGGVTDQDRVGESRYVVYVIRPTGDVQWRELGESKVLDRAIDAFRQALRDSKRNDVTQLARAVDERVMRPVRSLIGDATHLLVSPDGELDLIPFEALVDENGRYLLERYSITYLTAGRDLLRMQVPRESRSKPIVVADPFFGEPGSRQIAEARSLKVNHTKTASARRSITTGQDLSTVYFAPLIGTAQEAHTIHSLFPEARVLTGERATEAALKGVDAPRILHIATHGFFLQDQGSDTGPTTPGPAEGGTRAIQARVNIENSLLRSGLALAGANLNKGGGDDGILTALEAANLNLWGTKLVTLSACDTGVGEVKNGEGVYGLRRAFFLAGTETLVMSLWPVSDYVTRELMSDYYGGLKKGLGRGEALRQAQLAMHKRKGHQHPFYWASFIQSGEWASLDGKR